MQVEGDLGDPHVKEIWGPPDPLGGRKWGSNFFLSHPLPQNPFARSRDFEGFEVL